MNQSVKANSPPTPRRNFLHYLAYFASVGAVVFIARTGTPRQAEDALIAGAISAGSVISRDWFKARLSPHLSEDPSATIAYLSTAIEVVREQANHNGAQLARASFLQKDLISAMRDLNDLLRLSPAEVEAQLKEIQRGSLANAFSAFGESSFSASEPSMPPAHSSTSSATHVPDSTTLRQSYRANRPGFDA